jgi:hypothetical protein
MQVSQQVSSLLVIQYLTESRHFGAAKLNNLGNALIVRGQTADAQVLFLENALQAWPFFPT